MTLSPYRKKTSNTPFLHSQCWIGLLFLQRNIQKDIKIGARGFQKISTKHQGENFTLSHLSCKKHVLLSQSKTHPAMLKRGEVSEDRQPQKF